MNNTDTKSNKSIIGDFLLFIMLIAIPAEPLIPDIIKFGCMGMMFLLIIFKYRKIYITPFLGFSTVFLLYMLISLSYTPTGSQGLNTIITLFSAIIYTLAIVIYAYFRYDNAEQGFTQIMNFYVIGTLLITLYTVFVERSYVTNGYWRLGKLVFENYGTFMVLSYSIIIALVWSFYAYFEKHMKIYLPLLVIFLGAAALSGTKKTIAAIILALPVYFFVKYRKKGFKLVAIMMILLAAVYLAYLLIMNNSFLYSNIGFRIDSYIQSIVNGTDGSQSISERANMRQYAMQWFADSPVFGNGVSSFRAMYAETTGSFLYSHCNYTEILCNHGLIGFVLYYGFMAYLLVKSALEYFRTNKSIHIFSVVFMVVVIVLDYGQVSYYRVHYLILYHLISLVLISDKDLSEEKADIDAEASQELADAKLSAVSEVTT